jgi:hypothetical protein
MSEPGAELTIDQQAEEAAARLGRLVLGRELTADEATAMAIIFKASAQALKHGFITRLAEQVRAERETESVEEFFENIKAD